ncbi:MAG: cytochrome-c peroxidase, partial [Oleispira antarctica]|nr:cytochrome-c peroxidase [Oleispira antarctica]MBQ0793711.1 cytochrome-c peroxidase [Oleispira antarctica]
MKAVLGKQLFHDKNLSLEMNQSCASCHSPDRGFIDDRANNASREGIAPAGSLGDNLVSIGDRNAPTAA